MRERPILFSAPMVRALLDGSKRQTRRVMKPQPVRIGDTTVLQWRDGLFQPERLPTNSNLLNHCPYGQPGDRLWVRETFALSVVDPDGGPPDDDPENYDVFYRATDTPGGEWSDGEGNAIAAPWKPSIHMPRWASRILLEMTGVRVERLSDISARDAKAEGVKPDEVRQINIFGASPDERAAAYERAAVRSFQELWEQINGAGSWDSNLWVWVVEFKRVTP